MAIIRVPAPPKQSFQKNRPISDLLASQIKHFKHIETKLDLAMPTSPHRIATENDAAQYIAEMTTRPAQPNPANHRSTRPHSSARNQTQTRPQTRTRTRG